MSIFSATRPLSPFSASGVTEVEVVQVLFGASLAARDLVEGVFHVGGELGVDEVGEVLGEEVGDAEAEEGGDQGAPAAGDVVAVGEGLDDGGVGAGSAEAVVFEFLDQRGFGVARRRLRFRCVAARN